jgi:hypothetical protein
MTKAVVFVDSSDMKITLPPEQAEMLSSKETIREIKKRIQIQSWRMISMTRVN